MIRPIIIMTGPPASGKTTVAKYLARGYAARLVDVGDALLRKLVEEGLSCKTRGEIGIVFLKQYDLDDIFDILIGLVSNSNNTVFDAVRFAQTCLQFRERFSGVSVWYIEADSNVRERRRRDSHAIQGWINAQIEKEWERYSQYDDECHKIRQMADIVIDNSRSFSELYSQINSTVKEQYK